ncbi:MAG TPA: hypothetical protein VFG87_21945 [Amycolatopsis sp.]|jgi:hypothetical protein|nr:hypothetical protein [Amycolatopsis sp.]
MPGNTSTAGALNTAVPAVPGVADIHIDPGNVLQVAKIINDQADELDDTLQQKLVELSIDAPAADVVSSTAVDAWNRLIASGDGSYAVRVQNYVKNLRDLATQLRTAAQQYQTGEEERAAALGDRGVDLG